MISSPLQCFSCTENPAMPLHWLTVPVLKCNWERMQRSFQGGPELFGTASQGWVFPGWAQGLHLNLAQACLQLKARLAAEATYICSSKCLTSIIYIISYNIFIFYGIYFINRCYSTILTHNQRWPLVTDHQPLQTGINNDQAQSYYINCTAAWTMYVHRITSFRSRLYLFYPEHDSLNP